MCKAIVLTVVSMLAITVAVLPTPAAATDAREALRICDKRGNDCTPTVHDNGDVTICVNNSGKTECVSCPQEGECLVMRKTPSGKSKLVAGKVSEILGSADGPTIKPEAPTSTTTARTVDISGTHSKREIKSACSAAGGSFAANLNGWSCVTDCKPGTGGCAVSCDTKGKCTGETPEHIKQPNRLRGIEGVMEVLTIR